MKNHRSLGLVASALLALGCQMLPTLLKAGGAVDSPEVTRLLNDTKAIAVQLKTDSADMDSFTRSKSSWQTFSSSLHAIKGHINNAGQLLAKLKSAESTGSPWQQTAIKRIEPLLQEMADHATATINFLNENQTKVHFPEFTNYVKANYALATDLEELLRTSIDYASDKAKLDSLSSK